MKIVSSIFLGALCCASAFGWGCEGHQITALIAEKHLTPRAKAAVDELLKDNPIDPGLSRFCKPLATDRMADAATWADDSKRGEKTGTWHYLDIPRGLEHVDLMKYCEPVGDSVDGKDRPGCVYTALNYELAILKDTTKPAAERAKALRYVIHLVGDMHMPLHTTANDDQGGNCTMLTLFGNPKLANLHGAWDYGIIQHYLQQRNQTPEQLAGVLDERFRGKGKGWLKEKPDFTAWIWEGHRVAEKKAYSKLRPKPPVEPAENGPGCAAEKEKTTAMKIEVGDQYAREAMPVIEKLLAKTGYRLADILNATFQ
jgi:hypothetical protein